MDEIILRDQNRVTVLAGVTDDSDQDIVMLRVDPITKRLLVAAVGGSSITLQTNGIANGSQSILNLVQGTNVTLVDNGVGGVTINATGGGSSAFSGITSGTNTTANMVVGTGASLATSGSGTIAATTVTTNANLTGVVTSVGNATAIADAALSIAKTSGLQTALDAISKTQMSAIFFGGGDVLAVGLISTFRPNYGGTFTGWAIDLADINGTALSGSIQIEVKKNGSVITASAKPTVTSATSATSTTLTGWTTTFVAGDLFEFSVLSVTTAQKATLALNVTK